MSKTKFKMTEAFLTREFPSGDTEEIREANRQAADLTLWGLAYGFTKRKDSQTNDVVCFFE